MTPLKRRMLEDMRIRNHAKSTEQSYLSEVARYALHYDKCPSELSAEEIRSYLVHLAEEQQVSSSRFAIAVAALRFVYTVTLDREWMVKYIPYPKRAKKLPVVLSAEEVKSVISATKNLRDRTMLSVLYGTGMRVAELADMKVLDVSSKRMVIKIRNGKRRKERQVTLSPQLLILLRQYWQTYRPKEYLFLTRFGAPIRTYSIQNICREAGERAEITVRVTPHVMRHCFACTSLDIGVDLRRLQVLLGHSSISTTAKYLHVSTAQISATPSPYDLIATVQGAG